MSAKTPEWAVPLQDKIEQLDSKVDRLLEQLQELSAARAHVQPPRVTQPTFCGYACSWDIDDAGWPSYIHLEDGTLALHREKQGHHWYSVTLGDGQYGEHFLKIRRASPPDGALVMPPPRSESSSDADGSLHDLHTLGRAVHGDKWPTIGPRLVQTHTKGRTDKSTEMQAAELAALIGELGKGGLSANSR